MAHVIREVQDPDLSHCLADTLATVTPLLTRETGRRPPNAGVGSGLGDR